MAPAGTRRSSDHSAISASSMRITRTRLQARGRPTQMPPPASVRSRSARISRPSITATGRHSVAPYGVQIRASPGSIRYARSTTSGRTGAPAEITRCRPPSCTALSCAWRARFSSSAGEPNMVVQRCRSRASISRRGSALAGRVGSMSGITLVMPRPGSNRAKGGKVGRSTSPARMPNASRISSTCDRKLRWVYSTPFGTPVEPEVNRIAASASGSLPGWGGAACAPSARSSSSVCPDQSPRRPTVTRVRMLARPQPNSRLAACASGMPMKACGCASARHSLSAARAMPGSTSTGTAPALNRPNISSKNATPCRTISTARTPAPMPTCARPAAMVSLARSSSA